MGPSSSGEKLRKGPKKLENGLAIIAQMIWVDVGRYIRLLGI